ncbi:MAG: rhodanese-like domain-containing protein [Betaproteobacteria bacterium]|jgi:rhodanese-related sulfurtransferase|nr:rhodanese-like domain-containing protein [Betaproteobacteria bacterium]
MTQITPQSLQQWLADESRKPPVLLDVREPWEYQTCHIDGSVLAPMNTIPARAQELDRDTDTVVICHHGARSYQVCVFLERNGFSNLYNLQGGVNAWADQVETTMPRY